MALKPEESEESESSKRSWKDDLRSPTRLAVLTLGGLLAFGILGVYMPLTGRIAEASGRLEQARQRQQLAEDVAHLRKMASLYQGRIPHGIDLSEWTEYLHEGVRKAGVRLLKVEPKKEIRMGPAKALGWRLETEGDFFAMARYVQWLESGPRIIRIDEMAFENSGGRLTMVLVIRGLVL